MSTNKQSTGPWQVALASILLSMYVVLGFAKAIVQYPPRYAVGWFVLAGFLGGMLLWIRLISRRTNWARWLFLAWFVWNYSVSPWHLQQGVSLPSVSATVQFLVQLMALAFLFLPAANSWFRSRASEA